MLLPRTSICDLQWPLCNLQFVPLANPERADVLVPETGPIEDANF